MEMAAQENEEREKKKSCPERIIIGNNMNDYTFTCHFLNSKLHLKYPKISAIHYKLISQRILAS